jgi:hypothetical protein
MNSSQIWALAWSWTRARRAAFPPPDPDPGQDFGNRRQRISGRQVDPEKTVLAVAHFFRKAQIRAFSQDLGPDHDAGRGDGGRSKASEKDIPAAGRDIDRFLGPARISAAEKRITGMRPRRARRRHEAELFLDFPFLPDIIRIEERDELPGGVLDSEISR